MGQPQLLVPRGPVYFWPGKDKPVPGLVPTLPGMEPWCLSLIFCTMLAQCPCSVVAVAQGLKQCAPVYPCPGHRPALNCRRVGQASRQLTSSRRPGGGGTSTALLSRTPAARPAGRSKTGIPARQREVGGTTQLATRALANHADLGGGHGAAHAA
jgi:hypothetical protein